MKLSVVMPVYNERATLRTVVERVLAVPLDLELLCVDDGSQDGSREILVELPAYIDGAKPGDDIKVSLLSFAPSGWGWAVNIPSASSMTGSI